jgi:vitamin B12 transporter
MALLKFTNRVTLIFSVLSFLLTILIHLPVDAADESSSGGVYLGVTATTPSRLDEPAEDASGSVTILTEPEMETQNSVTLPEILRDVPGVSLKESGTMGESAKLTIRGTEPFQTLILLDGIRLNSPFRGDFDFGNLITDEIGQVEIVRGAQSVLYGSEAMGGVVNLKTKRGRGPLGVSLTQEAGSDRTFREVFSMSEGQHEVDYSLTLSRTDTGGQFDHDDFRASSFAGQVGFPVRDAGRIQFISRFQKDDKELATDILPVSETAVQVVSDENNEIQKRFSFYSIQYQDRVAPWLELVWKAAVVDAQQNWKNPVDAGSEIPNSYFEDTNTRTLILDFQQNFLISESDTLTFGIERERGSVDSEITVFDMVFPVDESRENLAYYLQNLFKWEDRFVLQTGIRLDNNSSFDTVISPKISSAYELKSTRTRLRSSWGTGFRAPTIQELFFPVFGNPELESEENRSWEVGVQQRFLGETIIIDVVYFRIDYEDLIQRSPTGVGNIGEARTEGVESAIEVRLVPSLNVKANYTYLGAENKDEDERLPFRPRHQGTIGLLCTPTVSLVVNLDINMVSSQKLPVDFILLDESLLKDESPGYTRVDLSGAYQLFKPFLGLKEARFFIKVNNLFDKNYQEVPGFPAPGVSFLAGITAIL